jgi:hypothetical protein
MRIGRRREQAATCLKALGIPLVLAGSVGVTYQRNAFNNGFMAISSPLVRAEYCRSARAKCDEPALGRAPWLGLRLGQLLDFLRARLTLARPGAPAAAELTLRTRLAATIDFAKWSAACRRCR